MTINAQRRVGGSRGPVAFKQREATRLMRAAQAAGLTVVGVEHHNGTVRVLTVGDNAVTTGKPVDETNDKTNPWDEVLHNAAHEKRAS